MLFVDELHLLIKSKYPLIYVETPDEEYVLGSLKKICKDTGLIFYDWTVTDGLMREDTKGCFYKTQDPVTMIQTAIQISKVTGVGPGVFILKDFQKHLESELNLRYFKDWILQIENTPDTLVMVSSEYKLRQSWSLTPPVLWEVAPRKKRLRPFLVSWWWKLHDYTPL